MGIADTPRPKGAAVSRITSREFLLRTDVAVDFANQTTLAQLRPLAGQVAKTLRRDLAGKLSTPGNGASALACQGVQVRSRFDVETVRASHRALTDHGPAFMALLREDMAKSGWKVHSFIVESSTCNALLLPRR